MKDSRHSKKKKKKEQKTFKNLPAKKIDRSDAEIAAAEEIKKTNTNQEASITQETNFLLSPFFFLLQDVSSAIRPLRKYILPVLLIYTLLIFLIADILIRRQIRELTILSDPFPQFIFAKYPVADKRYTPDLSATAAVIMDAPSKVFLYEKNDTLRFSPASTTKIMSALVALDYFKPTDILTVKRQIDTQGSGLGLVVGEKMTFQNLLYGMMLPSANDAAVAVADNYPGGESAYVAAMNAKAKDLQLQDTHFIDPDGLDDQDFTSAKDLVRLASIAIYHPVLTTVVATKEKTIQSADGKFVYDIKNRNKLLQHEGVTGIKTGYTEDAGEVLATSAVLHGHTYLLVVMKSDDRFADTAKLLDYLDHHITYLSIHP